MRRYLQGTERVSRPGRAVGGECPPSGQSQQATVTVGAGWQCRALRTETTDVVRELSERSRKL